MLGPLVRVEMLTSARRFRNYLLRSAYVGVLALCLWGAYESVGSWRGANDLSRMSAVGEAFFATFSVVQLLAVLLCAPAYTCGAVALEKDHKTLELLLTSQLSAWEIVVGKYVSRLLHVVMVLACGVPMLMWGMLFGGFSTWQVAAVMALAVGVAMAAGALGLCLSVWAKRTRQALVGTYALLLLYLVVVPLGLAVVDQIPNWGFDESWWLGILHPFFLLGEVIEYRGDDVPRVWAFAGGCAVVSLLLVALAVWRLRPVYIRQTYGTPKRVKRRRRNLPPVWSNPVAWKEVFTLRHSGLGRLSMVVYVLLFACFVFSYGYERWRDLAYSGGGEPMLRMAVPTLIGLTLVLAGLTAAGLITGERDRHTLEVLLATPLGGSQIVWGKLLGVGWRMMGWLVPPVLLLVVATKFGAINPLVWFGLRDGELSPLSLPCVLVCTAVYFAFTVALGLCLSLRSRTSGRARVATLAIMIFLGGGYMMCCFPVMVHGTVGSHSGTIATVTMLSPVVVLGFATFPPDSFSMDGDAASFVVAAILYVAAYALGAVMLVSATIARFDRRLRGDHARFD